MNTTVIEDIIYLPSSTNPYTVDPYISVLPTITTGVSTGLWNLKSESKWMIKYNIDATLNSIREEFGTEMEVEYQEQTNESVNSPTECFVSLVINGKMIVSSRSLKKCINMDQTYGELHVRLIMVGLLTILEKLEIVE
jgi:hypothetical protein